MKNCIREFVVPAALIVVLLSLVWPVARDHAMVMAQKVVLLAGFIVFALWVWREVGGDERDTMHRFVTGRVAYLSGSAVLIVGILRQSAAGSVDSWLVGALITMVAAKVAGSVYVRMTR